MASSTPALAHLQSACVTCVRGGQRFVGRYRDFLLAPGTIFTLVSLLLLVAATIATPDGVINSAHAHTWLFRCCHGIWWRIRPASMKARRAGFSFLDRPPLSEARLN